LFRIILLSQNSFANYAWMGKTPLHISFLRDNFFKRQKLNPNFSLRSFARYLNVTPSWISMVLNEKLPLSYKKGEQIFRKLTSSEEEFERLLQSTIEVQKNRHLKRTDPKVWASDTAEGRRRLRNYKYDKINRWYHSVLLELIDVDSFKGDLAWIAEQLGITQLQAKSALADLMEEKLISFDGKKFVRSKYHLTTSNKNSSSASLRNIQKEVREVSIQMIDKVPLNKRSHTHITMATDPALIGEAKARIQQFQKELCDFLEQSDKKEVYILELGLFPIHMKEKG
jgi:uncharacterized protein (TIGR02147 family)